MLSGRRSEGEEYGARSEESHCGVDEEGNKATILLASSPYTHMDQYIDWNIKTKTEKKKKKTKEKAI